ncbi:type VI secretion system tube protein Hcp [Microvirga sp. 0TCS3.31]
MSRFTLRRSQMIADTFLKLTDIDGEAKDATHKGEIEVLGWKWEATQAGRTSGSVDVHDLTVTKLVDKATCKLILACFSGTVINEGVLVVRQQEDKPVEYIKYTLEKVKVRCVKAGSDSDSRGKRVTEDVSFSFEKVKVDYQTEDGKPAGNMGWNIAENQKY